MPSVITGADGCHANPGVRSNAWAFPDDFSHLSATVSVGASVPVVCAELVVVKVGLHGPYETAGRPFDGAPRLLTSRIARTRQWIVAVEPAAAWNVKYSRSSATLVKVSNAFSGCRSR